MVTRSLRLEVFLVAFAFLAYKGGVALAAHARSSTVRPAVTSPFLWALVALVGFSLAQAALMGAERATGPGWFAHPNVFAHALTILGFVAAAAVGVSSRWLVLVALLGGVVLTGSRSGLVVFVVALLFMAFTTSGWRRTSAAVLVVGVLLVASTSLAFPGSPWAQRILSPLYSALGTERQATNLLIRTEALDDATYWNQLGTVIERALPADSPAVWRVTRAEAVEWARPQQALDIDRGTPLTLSATFKRVTAAAPGFIGWAQGTDDPSAAGAPRGGMTFEVALDAGSAPRVSAAGLVSHSARYVDLGDGWSRLEFTFVVAGEGRVRVGVGVSPGVGSPQLGDAVEVRELQLEAGDAVTPYQPSIARTTGVGEALARVAIFRAAVRGIAQAPVLGHGSHEFPEFYRSTNGEGESPAHPHNAYLDAGFTSGVVGLVALLSVLGALYRASGRVQRAVLAGLAVANLVDSTFMSGSVLYLLAFVAPFAEVVDARRVRPLARDGQSASS
jgi:hypothetical protein